MRARLARVLAGVPGARRAVQWARPRSAVVVARLRRRRSAELAALVASVRGSDRAEIAVLGPATPGLLDAVRAASPQARVTEFTAEVDERHVAMTALRPFDVILDRQVEEGRRHRFETTFFHLRPGGAYLVPRGASELGSRPGPLGELLRTDPATEMPEDAMERVRELGWLVAERVTRRAVGNDLLLGHDIPRVLVKLREWELNRVLELRESPHRVLKTFPAEAPAYTPEGSEGPVPRDWPMHRRINEATISLREYRNVLVAPRQLLVSDRMLLPESFRHNQWPALIHSQLIDYGPRFAVPRRKIPAKSPRLRGTFLHLDNEYRGHFGHLLTESLSRAWSWPEALAIDPEARVLVGATPRRPELLDYELDLYEACGIPRERMVLIDGPVRVERLISGTPMFSHPQYVHPRIAATWRTVGDRLAERAVDREWPRRFFVARRGEKRACLNAPEVEAIFAEYGFEVVYPEDYSLAEQVRLFRAAEVVAGYAGSGLFQTALVPDPTHVIMVGPATYTPRNEYLMAAVNGHRVEAVICEPGGEGIQTSYSFNVEREGPFLRSLLDRLP